MTHPDNCFHCALPVPPDCDYTVRIDDVERPVCCIGCRAVAELIRDAGMSNYYALREVPEPGVGKPDGDEKEWRIFNSPEMRSAFAQSDEHSAEATVYVGGMYCSACGWLIDTSLSRISGVDSVDVNPITHRIRVRWQHATLGLGDILGQLAQLGYDPQPLTADDGTQPEVTEQRMALKRLLVASLGMMQVMMFAIGLYVGEFQGIDADMERFLRLVSFFVTTPVVFYSAKPFFVSAWRGVSARMPGMDLPVSIAIGAAYAASVYSTFTNGDAVWFDSVTMFVFFLTLGRYLEMRARHRSIDRSAALSRLVPNTAGRLNDGTVETVPVARLVSGDIVRIRPGDSVPADGIVVEGESSADESLLTGESAPRRRKPGNRMAAGSINLDGVVDLRVEATGNDTALGAISRLSERARYARPSFVQIADRIASYIVVALLLVAGAVAAYWYGAAPERAFVITLSVLVVTCPCALALATPAAFAAAGSRLSQLRLLVTNGNAIEVLARATHFVFDKTGTLTSGRPDIERVHVFDRNYSEADCIRIAATLEQISSHPIAAAFHGAKDLLPLSNAKLHVAEGVSGTIDGTRWRIGSAAFTGVSATDLAGACFLAADDRCIARFEIVDELRPGAREVIDKLRTEGARISLLSGDNKAAVRRVATALSINDYRSACTPANKLSFIAALQDKGERVVMTGDGINDAPVLAGADASIAPAHAALLAQTSADIIMLGDSLRPLSKAVEMSKRTLRIVRQNLAWAVIYNTLALPLAAAGLVPPWAAAIGMSASSLVVVLNALRLNRYN